MLNKIVEALRATEVKDFSKICLNEVSGGSFLRFVTATGKQVHGWPQSRIFSQNVVPVVLKPAPQGGLFLLTEAAFGADYLGVFSTVRAKLHLAEQLAGGGNEIDAAVLSRNLAEVVEWGLEYEIARRKAGAANKAAREAKDSMQKAKANFKNKTENLALTAAALAVLSARSDTPADNG